MGGDDDKVASRESDENISVAKPLVGHNVALPALEGQLYGVVWVVEICISLTGDKLRMPD